MTATLLLLSDTHLPPQPENGHYRIHQGLFPAGLPSNPREAQLIFDYWCYALNQANLVTREFIDATVEHVDGVIHLGDVCAPNPELGCADATVEQPITDLMQWLQEKSHMVGCTLGNHDLGDSTGTFLPLSLEEAQKLIGDLFWAFKIEDVVFIGVCSALARYTGADPLVFALKQQQEAFVRATLEQNDELHWVLCAHSPLTPLHLKDVLAPHTNRLEAFLYGDFHHPRIQRWWQKLVQWFHPFLCTFICQGVFVPSVAPLWCDGQRFVLLHVNHGHIDHQVIHIPTSTFIRSLPITRPWWALYTMIKYFVWTLPWRKLHHERPDSKSSRA